MLLNVLVLVFIILLFIILAIGCVMMRFITHPNRPDFEETRAREIEANYWGDFDTFPQQEWNITSFDGTLLHGTYIENATVSNKYIILTHGYSYNRHGSIKYANIFYRLGFNIYLYDLRYHGANEHKKNYCTMGEAEHQDLLAVIDAVYERFGNDIFLGIHGESLGAASSVLATGKRQHLSFCIADCPFSDLQALLYYQAKQMFHLPKWMVHVTNACYHVLKKGNFLNIKPKEAIQNNQVPLLLIHGAADDFIPPSHSQEIYDACPDTCIKKIHFMPGAKHAESYGVNATLYATWVSEFLNSL